MDDELSLSICCMYVMDCYLARLHVDTLMT